MATEEVKKNITGTTTNASQEVVQGNIQVKLIDAIKEKTNTIQEIFLSDLGNQAALLVATYEKNPLGGDDREIATKVYVEDISTYSYEQLRDINSLYDLYSSYIDPEVGGVAIVKTSTLSGNYNLFLYGPDNVLIGSLNFTQLNTLLDKGIIQINDVKSVGNKITITSNDIKATDGKTIQINLDDIRKLIADSSSSTGSDIATINQTISEIQSKDVEQDTRLDNLEEYDKTIDVDIAELNKNKADSSSVYTKDLVYTKKETDELLVKKEDISDLKAKYSSYTVKLAKAGLTTTIVSDPKVNTNLLNVITATPTITGCGTTRFGDNITYPTIAISGTAPNLVAKLPVVKGLDNSNLLVSLSIWGKLTATPTAPKSFLVALKKADGTIIGRKSINKFDDIDFNGRVVSFPTFVLGASDPLISGGFYVDILNNSGSPLSLTQVEILIQGS